MLYTVYKTTNIINGKYYIGSHKCKNPNDSYLGSGVALKRAIEKYGIENFSKEVLFVYDNPDEMYAKEKELVEVNKMTYNLMEGGKGGWDHVDASGENNPMKNPDTVAKVFSNRQLGEKFYSAAKQNLKKATECNKGRKRPEHSEFMKQHSNLLKQMEENYDEWRASLGSATYELTMPSGESIITDRLKDVCRANSIPFTTMYNAVKTGVPVKQGKAKGWSCKKL